MTSPANDAETRAFFDEHRHFGLPREDVVFFTQGQMPALSRGRQDPARAEAPDRPLA